MPIRRPDDGGKVKRGPAHGRRTSTARRRDPKIFESQMTGLMDALSDAQAELRDLKAAMEQLKADPSHRH